MADIGFDDSPKRQGRQTVWLLAGVVIFIAACSLAFESDEAARGQGRVVAAGLNLPVQHEAGGRVKVLSVADGQYVRKGDLLVSFDPVETTAAERSTGASVLKLLAARARSEAEQALRRDFSDPEEFGGINDQLRAERPGVLEESRSELKIRYEKLDHDLSLIDERGGRLRSQLASLAVQVSHSDEQLELVQQELDSIRPLLEKGYIPLTRVRALERTLSVQKAASAQWRAQIVEVTSLQRENEQNRLNTLAAFRERAANERRDIDLQIARFGPELEVATSRRHFNDLLAPHDGWVLDLSISGADQIVSPRSTFMWIVPDTKSFIIEAEFFPKDTNALTVDHPAFVRFSGSGRRNAAVVKGRITSISPDIVLNDLGTPVKKARIAISEADLKQSNFSTGWQHLRPGTPAEVMAVVRRRTLAEYLVEPLTAATWRAFREP